MSTGTGDSALGTLSVSNWSVTSGSGAVPVDALPEESSVDLVVRDTPMMSLSSSELASSCKGSFTTCDLSHGSS